MKHSIVKMCDTCLISCHFLLCLFGALWREFFAVKATSVFWLLCSIKVNNKFKLNCLSCLFFFFLISKFVKGHPVAWLSTGSRFLERSLLWVSVWPGLWDAAQKVHIPCRGPGSVSCWCPGWCRCLGSKRKEGRAVYLSLYLSDKYKI